MRVVSVMPGGPAARVGIRQGDVIVVADGQPVTEPSQLVSVVERIGVGRPLNLRIDRQGRRLELDLTPVELGSLSAR